MPERLADGLNTSAEETDPWPVGAGGELFFASNRALPGRRAPERADYDIYRAEPGLAGSFAIEPFVNRWQCFA